MANQAVDQDGLVVAGIRVARLLRALSRVVILGLSFTR